MCVADDEGYQYYPTFNERTRDPLGKKEKIEEETFTNIESLTTENGHEIHVGNKMLFKSEPLNQASMLRSGTKDRKKVTEEMGH